MKLTRRNLIQIIKESLLLEKDDENQVSITLDVPKHPGVSFTVTIKKDKKAKVFFEDEEGKVKRVRNNNKEHKDLLFGALRGGYDTAKDDNMKNLIIKAYALLTDQSTDELDLPAVKQDFLSRHTAALRDHLYAMKTPILMA